MTLTLRQFRPADAAELAQIFHDAVQIGAASHYSVEQRLAWSPNVPSPEIWARRLEGLVTFVAEAETRLAGFMSLAPKGLVDLAFVSPRFVGCGVGYALYGQVESHAKGLDLNRLSTEASHVARAFFLRQGWQEIAPQKIIRDGVTLENFLMEKCLVP